MAEEFEIMTLTGENGEDEDFDLVDAIEHGGKKYCILFPTGMTRQERDEEYPLILEYVMDGDEDYLEDLADEDEYDEIYGIYLDGLE
ncbi:MAG: DUF1292 domain-containing protein [Oscillospiraceae bacterium]